MRSLPMMQVAVGLACGASCADGSMGRAVAFGLMFAGLSCAGGLVRAKGAR